MGGTGEWGGETLVCAVTLARVMALWDVCAADLPSFWVAEDVQSLWSL